MSFYSTILSWFGLGGATTRIPGRQDDGGPAIPSAKPVTADTALALSAVWACVKLISEAVGAMPINVWRISPDGTRTLNPDHPIARLFRNGPNRYQTRNEFWETMILNLELHGNCYARPAFGVGSQARNIVSLLPLMAQQMDVNLERTGERTYSYTDGQNIIALRQDQVWHVPMMPGNGVIGLSPLRYAARTMGIAMSAEDRVSIMAANGFKPTGVLMIDNVLSPEQRTAIRTNFSDLQNTQGDALRVLEAGMTYQQISISPKDAQLLESRQFSTQEIARIYGVPSVLINDTSTTTAWGSGIAQIKEGFYTLTLRPLLEKLESSMERWLLQPGERGSIEIEFDFSAFLRGDEATRVKIATDSVSGSLRTINEVRAGFGLGPVEGGDNIYGQAQLRPLSELQKGTQQ